MKRILRLRLRKCYFDDIVKGGKIAEYRDIKPYWTKRLCEDGKPRVFDEIWFTNGYGHDSPFMRVECKRITNIGNVYYRLGLGRILEIKNWKG